MARSTMFRAGDIITFFSLVVLKCAVSLPEHDINNPLPQLIGNKKTVRAQYQNPGGKCFCSMRDSSSDDYGDISPYYVEKFGHFAGPSDEPDDPGEEQNEIAIWNSVPQGSVFEKLELLRKYWKEPWVGGGEEADTNTTELACNTVCSTNRTTLGVCGDYINYKFCGRKLTINQSSIAAGNITGYDWYIGFLASTANGCVDSTIWKERDGAGYETSDCHNAIMQGACSMLFPKCDANDEPLPVCRSVCQNERLSCRRSGSNFGTLNEIRDACSGDPFVDDAYPSDVCTGRGSSDKQVMWVVWTAVIAFAIAHF